MSWACKSVGKPGKGCVSTGDRSETFAAPRYADTGRPLLDLDSARAQCLQRLVQEVGTGAIEQHLSSGHGCGHGISPRLDTIG